MEVEAEERRWSGYNPHPEYNNPLPTQYNRGGSVHRRSEQPHNPKSADGQYLTCHSCGFFRHMMANCLHSWENMKNVNVVEEKKGCLFTGYNKKNIQLLDSESRNCAMLDSACTSTVHQSFDKQADKRWI